MCVCGLAKISYNFVLKKVGVWFFLIQVWKQNILRKNDVIVK